MKAYKYTYIFFVSLFVVVLNTWAQPDTVIVTKDSTKNEINIAYGKQEKSIVSSSVSSISGDELTKSSVTNFGSTLYGKLPGLFVNQGNGEPGYDSPSLRLRSFSSNPLVIIDGFERDLTYITPEEIESVTVLKDASALALYGMKGANGAILITTKRGAIQPREITFKVQSGLQMPVKTFKVLDAANYMTLYNEAAINDGLQPKYTQQDIAAAGSNPRYPDVNWKDEVLKNQSIASRAMLGVTGGSEFIRYYVNLGFLYNDGMYEPENPEMNSNANLTRLNLRSNIDLSISKTTTFSMDLAGNMNKSSYPAYSAYEIWDAIFSLPPNAFNIKNPDDSYGGTSLLLNNPVAMLETSGRNNSVDHFLNAGFKLRQKLDFIANGLSASLNYVLDNGANNSDGNWRYFQVREIAAGSGENYEYYTYRDPTSYNTWSSARSSRSTIFSADMVYDMPETNGNDLNILVRYQGDRQYLANTDLVPYLVNNYGVRLQYAYHKTYVVEFAASYYGSDHFAEDERYGFFPSASAAWVLSNESFLKGNDMLTFAKLRASYGINGYNRYENGRYPFAQFYVGASGFPLGDIWEWSSGIQPGMMANPDYTWETSNKLNIGAELAVMNNITLDLDYYNDKKGNMLYIDYTRPSVSGANLPYENIGETTITGFDAKLGYASAKNKTLNWFGDIIFSVIKSNIDEMGEAKFTGDLSYLNKTGHSVTAIFGYETDGVFQSESEIQSSPVQTFGTPRVGDLKYKDQNEDNVIDGKDAKVIGGDKPLVDLGLRLGVNYKNFDIEMMFQGRFNRDINVSNNKLTRPFLNGNAVTEIANESDFPALSLSNMNNYQTSSFWVRNGNFVKLRNIELGYTLPENITNSMKMTNARIFIRGVNLLSFSEWDYSDPEFTWIGYPPMKTYFIGLNINF